jgi:para-nitrobenzyl esterase
MEISFVFNNIYLGRHMTGTEKEAYALADKMSDVWVSFAKDGNPSIKKLSWEPYNPETKPTMIFDVETKLVYDDDPIIKAMAEQEPFRWNF